MERKCEKCFYFDLCTQYDYIFVDERNITNNYCGIYENGIPTELWNENKKCENFTIFS